MINTPRGTRDIVGDEANLFEFLVERFKNIARLNGFNPIITPIIEYFELFEKKSGEEIIKSMYVFEDKAGRRIALRPELTAPVVRAFLGKLRGMPRPLMFYYVGQCFRYEEPQRGRYREFWQAGLEVIGEQSIDADIKVINVIEEFLTDIGLDHYYVVGNVGIYRKIMNVLGIPAQEQDHILHLIDKGMIEKAIEYCNKFGEKVVDAINILINNKLENIVDSLKTYVDEKTVNELYGEVEKTITLLEFLKEFGAKADYDPKLVRGLAYYNSVIYEVKTSGLEISIGGGGRYDGLTTVYGGPFEYATGAALGIDRIMLAIESKKKLSYTSKGVIIIVIDEEPRALHLAYSVTRKLHEYGIYSKVIVGKKISKALSLASREKQKYAIIIGPKEVKENRVTIKDLEKGVQETVDIEHILNYIACREFT
ncbi:histidine--tRNA ligase [Desulfurococcaceae archaeon MEX13E-LK6-19]|nr:histidine--tRNA ligase [Desulfurococcaceae archaeon MEX13E-LK6-19]